MKPCDNMESWALQLTATKTVRAKSALTQIAALTFWYSQVANARLFVVPPNNGGMHKTHSQTQRS